MQALYVCIAHRHDLRLVVLAALICGLGVHAGFALCREALSEGDARTSRLWTGAAIVSGTSAIWATHFIAMLAFEPGLPFGFDLPLTALSFAVALMMVGAAVMVVLGGQTHRRFLLAGAVAGLAVTAMHHTGMSAFQTEGTIGWDPSLLALSVASGLVFGCLAGAAASSSSRRIRFAAPWAYVLAIVLDHFYGMTAVRITSDPRMVVPNGGVDKIILVLLVANVALFVVALSVAALWLATRDRRQHAAEELRLRDLADIAVEGLMICRGDTIVSVNRSLERTLNCTDDKLVGRSIGTFLPGLDAGTVPIDVELDTFLHCATAGSIPVRVIGQHTAIGKKSHLVVAVRDQRERLRNERRIMQLAHQDALTEVANRLSFNETLAERLLKLEAGRSEVALLTLDLDRFKAVNDTFGHGIGDELLRRVAGRLRSAVREDDHIARLGGDEFAVILDTGGSLAPVRAVAENITDLLSRPFLMDGHVIEVATSVGIALAPSDADEPAGLARHADLALYRAKQEGGNTYRLFEAEMNARMQARRALEADLRRALLWHEFEVHYQPLVMARTGAYAGAEALVRWRHPERGLVAPAEFIPLAEEIGLIGGLGEWVLRTACAEATTWPDGLPVAVNMSAIQFRDPRLVSTVAGILADTGLPGSRLELEVTESVLMQDGDSTAEALHALRALGIRISMDDFGTGYSSLSYLRRFPFDKIKIDQSFARQTPSDRYSVAIVQAIATLGAKLGMTVTVEGVETSAQHSFMVAEGCDQIQGYLISRPVQADELRRLFVAPQNIQVA